VTRRRWLAVLAFVGALTACDTAPGDDSEAADTATASCTAEEQPPLQTGSHLIGDAEPPVPYSSTPPTSGWHASGRPRTGVTTEPLTDPQVVSVLEGGAIVAAYDPARVDGDQLDRLTALATGPHDGRLTVTPYVAEMPSPVTLVAWGVLQRCDDVDTAAVTAFVLRHHGQVGSDH
jgi:hypothetical protein